MELPTAPFVFISSEGKQASFFLTGKLQISLAKSIPHAFPKHSVLFIYIYLWFFEVSVEALLPKNCKARLVFLFSECQLYLGDVILSKALLRVHAKHHIKDSG